MKIEDEELYYIKRLVKHILDLNTEIYNLKMKEKHYMEILEDLTDNDPNDYN